MGFCARVEELESRGGELLVWGKLPVASRRGCGKAKLGGKACDLNWNQGEGDQGIPTFTGRVLH